MKKIIFTLIVNTISVFIVTWMLSGIHLEHTLTAILVAVALALLNTFLKPLLVMLTIPFSVFSMGFFVLVINASLVMLAGRMVPGFVVSSFWAAFWFSVLMSVVSFLLLMPERIRQQQIVFRRFSNSEGFPPYDSSESEPSSSDFEDAEIVEDEDEGEKPHDSSSDKYLS